MPSAALDFRVRCGGFVAIFIHFMAKRARLKLAMRIRVLRVRTRATGVMVGLVLHVFFFSDLLLRCGDVETNPGPKNSNSLKQSRLTSEGASRRSSSDSSTVRGPAPSPSTPGNACMNDILDKLTCMDVKFNFMSDKLEKVSESVDGVKEDVHDIKDRIFYLQAENDALKSENRQMKEKMECLEKKVDDLEGRSKRDNLIFYGIPRRENETKQECEETIQTMLTDKLELSRTVEFDRLHRLSNKPNSPIIGKCTYYKDKEVILKAKKKLKGSSISIGEDYTQRVRDIRKKLWPHLKAARDNGKRASMIFDHLLIEGKKFVLDGEDQICEVK